MKPDLSEKLTVVIKTFERPDMITRAVSSLRSLHPTIPVIIADDSKEPTSFDDDPYTTALHLPFDTGISYGRNRAIEKVETPYYLLIDDDHCFKKDANLQGLVDILDTTDFDIVAMRMLNYRAGKGYCRGELFFAGTFERENDTMMHYVGKDRGLHLGYPLYDIVLNCYAARKKKAAIIKFDENIKIGKEHGDYFLEAMKRNIKVTVSKNSYIHHLPIYSEKYAGFRKRSGSYADYYFKKHGISSEKTIGKDYRFFDKVRYFPQKVAYWISCALGKRS